MGFHASRWVDHAQGPPSHADMPEQIERMNLMGGGAQWLQGVPGLLWIGNYMSWPRRSHAGALVHHIARCAVSRLMAAI